MAGATTGAVAMNSSRMLLLSAVWRWDQVPAATVLTKP
jgi:hypothetical protein